MDMISTNQVDATRLPYIYNYNRHNEFNLNLGYLGLSASHEKYRANLKFHTGTYVIDNYSSEPELLRLVHDANVGLSLNKKNNLWLDVGIFGGSFIGFESTLGFENMNLAPSILSENVPYFISGASISYKPKNWTLAFWWINGWQRIKRVEGNSLPSFGTQVQYEKNKWQFGWSTFLGTDDPDSTRRMRFFNHLNANYQLSDRWKLVGAFDIGLQQESKGSSKYNEWIGIAAVLEYKMAEKWFSILRYEYYSDPDEVIISTTPKAGFSTSSFTLSFRHHLNRLLIAKMEARYFNSPKDVFPKDGAFVNNNLFIAGAILFKLDGEFK